MNVIYIKDEIGCKSRHLVEQYFHTGPECTVNKHGEQSWLIEKGSIKVLLTHATGIDSERIRGAESPPLGWFSKKYGHKEPTNVLRQTATIMGSKTFATRIAILNLEESR